MLADGGVVVARSDYGAEWMAGSERRLLCLALFCCSLFVVVVIILLSTSGRFSSQTVLRVEEKD